MQFPVRMLIVFPCVTKGYFPLWALTSLSGNLCQMFCNDKREPSASTNVLYRRSSLIQLFWT